MSLFLKRTRIPAAGVTIVVLTLLTQIGGMVWLAGFLLMRAMKWRGLLTFTILFFGLYGAASVAASRTAAFFGRVPLSCWGNDQSPLIVRSPLFCILNRHYVTPKMKDAAEALANHMEQEFPGTQTLALDGNFPFFDGFPLLPHLSHADGRKLDIAFYYRDENGRYLEGRTRSPIGYFAFEQPSDGARAPCDGKRNLLTLRWDFGFLQPLWPRLSLEENRNRAALQWLSTDGRQYGVEKIFVEPHVAERLGVSGDIIRFQGCRAARHDDHIHMQVAS